MKKVSVRVKSFKIALKQSKSYKTFIETQKDMEYDRELEEIHRRMQEEIAIANKAYADYCAMFPNDDAMYFKDNCEGTIEGVLVKEGWLLYLWGVENHKHWWEKEDLPSDVFREPQPEESDPNEIFFLPQEVN